MLQGLREHLHQDLLEGAGLSALETLALVDAGVLGLQVAQCDGEGAPQGVIGDGCAAVPPLQEGQQPPAVCADHPLARALLAQLAAPGLAPPPVCRGVVGAGHAQGLARHALEHGGVVGTGQLCDGQQEQQPQSLHALPAQGSCRVPAAEADFVIQEPCSYKQNLLLIKEFYKERQKDF